METRLLVEVMEALSRPFAPADISWKPGAVTKDGSKALALAYADSRIYQDRLNETVGADWQDDYAVLSTGNKVVVTCRLSVCGVSRCDVGECDGSDPNAVTTAASQAFKRAATKFQIGRYLYSLPSRWMPYDSKRKRFTDEALRKLGAAVSDGNSAPVPQRAGNGDELIEKDPEPTNGDADPTAFWSTVNSIGLDRATALAIAKGPGTWAEKIAALNQN